MQFDWWTLALQTVNFAVLVWLLHRFLYKPVLRLLDERAAQIQKNFDAAKAAETQAETHRAAMAAEEARIAAARDGIMRAAAAQAEEAIKAQRSQAQRDAAALVETTRKSLNGEREHALAEVRRAALDLGLDIARRLLADIPLEVRADAWLQRIEEHVAAMSAPERDALVRQFTNNGAALQLVTAAPLPPPTAERWSNALHRIFGDQVSVALRVDPALIAGAELHFPSSVLRFSWQSMLAGLRSELETHVNAR